MDDPKYPYTLMDNTRMEKDGEETKEHRQQPPPYNSGYTSPTVLANATEKTEPEAESIPAPMYTVETSLGFSYLSHYPPPPDKVAYDRLPIIVTCPHCGCCKKTRVTGGPTLMTYLKCLLLSSICCCCIGYCLLRCRKIDHFCTNCDEYLESYNPMQGLSEI